MKLCKRNIRGQDVDIEIYDNGEFGAEVEGQQIHDKSLDGLVERLNRAMRQTSVKVAIRFVRWYEGKLKHGTITGIHASNRNLLVKWEGQKGVDQEYTWSQSEYLALSNDEEETFVHLCVAHDRAQDAVAAFIKAHRFDGVKAVKDAIEDSLAKEVQP